MTLALGSAAPASAQSAPPRAVSLADVLAAADVAPGLKASDTGVRAAQADLDAAGGWSPTTLSVSTTRATAHLIVGASVPLPVFGTLGANRDRARAELEVSRWEARTAHAETRTQAAAAFYTLARAEARAADRRAAGARETALAALVKSRVDAGDAPTADLLGASAAAAQANAEANAADCEVQAASALLAGALGWPPESPLHAEPGLLAPEPPTPLAHFLPTLDTHPEVVLAQARAQASGAQVAEARKAEWPTLALEGEASVDDPTLPGTDFRAGVSLDLPLFSGLGDATHAAELRAQAAEAEAAAKRQAQIAVVVAAWRRCEAATTQAQALETQVLPASREAARLARRAYEEGSTSLLAVLEAERALADSEASLVEARAEAALSGIELKQAAGEEP